MLFVLAGFVKVCFVREIFGSNKMTEAPKELWVVISPKGTRFSPKGDLFLAISRAVWLNSRNGTANDYEGTLRLWAEMQAEGWQCVKYVREE